jgi:hypothetical protein
LNKENYSVYYRFFSADVSSSICSRWFEAN